MNNKLNILLILLLAQVFCQDVYDEVVKLSPKPQQKLSIPPLSVVTDLFTVDIGVTTNWIMSTKYTTNFKGSNIPKTVTQVPIKPQVHTVDQAIPATNSTPYISLRQNVTLPYPDQVSSPQQIQPTIVDSSNTIITQLSIQTAPNIPRKINNVNQDRRQVKEFGPTNNPPNLPGGVQWQEPMTQIILTFAVAGKDSVNMATSSYTLFGINIAPTLPTQATTSEQVTNTVIEAVRLKINKANSLNLVFSFAFVLLLSLLY